MLTGSKASSLQIEVKLGGKYTKVNYSHILQEALKNYLEVSENPARHIRV